MPRNHGAELPELAPEVFDRADVGVLVTSGGDHALVYRNAAFEELFGPRRLGAPAAAALAEPRLQALVADMDRAYREGSAHRSTRASPAPGAPGRHFVHACSPVVVSRHGPGVLTVVTDTTRQVEAVERAERLLSEAARTTQRYGALMSAVPQSIWLLAPGGEVAELVGDFQDPETALWRPRTGQDWLDAAHPKDRARVAAAWHAATAGEPSRFSVALRLRAAGGPHRYRHVRAGAVPVLQDGTLTEWVGVISDFEDQWRARLRERILADMTAVPAAEDLAEAFAATAAAVVPELVDACTVFQLPRSGFATMPGSAAHPQAVRGRAAIVPGAPPLPPLPDGFRLGPLADRAIESRRIEVLSFPAGDPPRNMVSGPSAEWLTRAGATSLVLAPIVIDDGVLALAAAATCQGNPPPDRADLDMFGEILDRVQGPLRRTMKFQAARDTALTLQRALLTDPPRVPGAELAAHYQPASTDAEIGGDWYDAVLLPHGPLILAIGDVIGHDLDAATAMSQLRSMLRVIVYDPAAARSPAESLARLDRVAEGLGIASMVTVALATMEPRQSGGWRATLSNAGHPPPLLLPASGPARFLYAGDGPDTPLCVAPELPRVTWQQDLAVGDTLLLYTDGLVEVPGADLSHGLAGLAAQATALRERHRSVAELTAGLLASARGTRDDIAIIGFRAATP